MKLYKMFLLTEFNYLKINLILNFFFINMVVVASQGASLVWQIINSKLGMIPIFSHGLLQYVSRK